MTSLDMPKKFDFGAGDLVEVRYLQEAFDISRRTAMKYLKALRISPLYIGKEVFFSLPTFRRIMFVLTRPDAPGFIFPGSRKKNTPYTHEKSEYLTEVTDEVLEQAADPRIIAEMSACGGRDQNIIRKYVTSPQVRPRKGKKDE